MLVRIILAAILAGVLSGVFVTAAQSYRVTPLILEAEALEAADHSHAPNTPTEHAHDANGEQLVEGGSVSQPNAPAEAWAPKDGLERTLFTMIANMLVGVSFALIITAVVLVTNTAITLQSGLVWGLGGFVVFTLAPNFGLPPELPGMVGADLGERQSWWLATVVATATALLIFAFKQKLVWMLGALAILVAPHIYGAPVAAKHDNIVPANLAAEFVMSSLVTSLLFWLFLGGALGFLIERVKHQYKSEHLA